MSLPTFHATTVLCVRKDGQVAMGGDGQITVGDTVMKAHATKVRALKGGKILAGFAGAAADAFTLFEKFEEKLERYPGNLARAAVELAKDWRTDRYLRRLEAMMLVADKSAALIAGFGVIGLNDRFHQDHVGFGGPIDQRQLSPFLNCLLDSANGGAVVRKEVWVELIAVVSRDIDEAGIRKNARQWRDRCCRGRGRSN